MQRLCAHKLVAQPIHKINIAQMYEQVGKMKAHYAQAGSPVQRIGEFQQRTNAVVELVEGGDDVLPCERNVEAFIQWVHEHDLYQVPDTATDFLRDQEALNGDTAVSGNDDLTLLPRKMVLQLRANANVSLGSGYRAYPGFSVAQVRKQLEIGW